jgi:hypothetical protein
MTVQVAAGHVGGSRALRNAFRRIWLLLVAVPVVSAELPTDMQVSNSASPSGCAVGGENSLSGAAGLVAGHGPGVVGRCGWQFRLDAVPSGVPVSL